MNNLPNNFGKDDICEQGCSEAMDNRHLMVCPYLSEHSLSYEQLLNGNVNEKMQALRIMQKNAELRMKYLSKKDQLGI